MTAVAKPVTMIATLTQRSRRTLCSVTSSSPFQRSQRSSSTLRRPPTSVSMYQISFFGIVAPLYAPADSGDEREK